MQPQRRRPPSDESFKQKAARYLFAAIDEKNISVTGMGEVDGQGVLVREADDGVSEYPLLPIFTLRCNTFYFRGSENVTMQDCDAARRFPGGRSP